MCREALITCQCIDESLGGNISLDELQSFNDARQSCFCVKLDNHSQICRGGIALHGLSFTLCKGLVVGEAAAIYANGIAKNLPTTIETIA